MLLLRGISDVEATVLQNAQLQRFIVKQCVESRFGLASVHVDHVQLLYHAALQFDASFNIFVFQLDLGKRFACLITHALREIPLLRPPRLGVKRGTL